MKNTVLVFLLCIYGFAAFSQLNRTEASKSAIYVNGDYEDKVNDYKFIAIKELAKDTMLYSERVQKYQWTTFTDYEKVQHINYFYEGFSEKKYAQYDQKFKPVHQFNYQEEKEQSGIIFGTKGKIKLKYIDTRRSYQRDSLIPDAATPRKYYLIADTNKYVVILPDLQIMVVENNGINYTKNLIGDLFYNISRGLANKTPFQARFNLKTGDELQLFYRRKWYNDSTGVAEYEDKQFTNFRYTGDTLMEGKPGWNIISSGFNYLSGKEDEQNFSVIQSDSGYYIGQQFYPIKAYTPELRIIEREGEPNYVFLQAYVYDTIGTKIFPRVIQFFSPSPYRNFILPYFPLPYIEFGNVEGLITYIKQGEQEYGLKRIKTKITNRTHIRKITALNKKKVEVEFFLPAAARIEFKFYKSEEKLISIKKDFLEPGLHKLVLKTPKMKPNLSYQLQLEQRENNHLNVITHQFQAKF